MSGNFGWTPDWLKKAVKPKNYVELTLQQRADLEKANNKVKLSEAQQNLTKGLSGNGRKDLSKGVAVEKHGGAKRIDTGNGITRIEHSNGSVEFEIDYAKGYDGTPQLFAKGTKVTYKNKPKEPEKGFLDKVGDFIKKVDDWGNRASGGYIRKAGRGLATLLGIGVGTATVVAAAPVVTTAAATKATVATAAVVGAGALTSCSKDDGIFGDEPPVNVNVNVTNKQMADYVKNILNDPEQLDFMNISSENRQKLANMNLKPETSDGVKFKYDYDYNSGTDAVKPYITIGNAPNAVKLPVNVSNLQELSAGNVVSYIHQINDKLITKDGVGYDFKADSGKAQVAFDNGLIHNVGDDVTIKGNSATATLNQMFAQAGLVAPENGSITMGLQAQEGSYDNAAKGFEMKLVTPQLLKDVTSGSPHIQGSFSGVKPAVFDDDYNVVEDAKEVKLSFDGSAVKQDDGSVVVKNSDGTEIMMKPENEFFDGANTHQNAVVIYKKDGGEWKEQFVMSNMGNNGTEIGLIDRTNGTTLQHYPSNLSSFDTQGAVDADKYYNDKKTNLDNAYSTANYNYKFFNQWKAEAEAWAKVH